MIKFTKMKNKTNFLSLPLLFMGVFIFFASSCEKKDDDNINNTTSSFTDPRDGYVYKTVAIGDKIWLAENLKYLPIMVHPDTGSRTMPYYYVYDYEGTNVVDAKATVNYKTYGVLYNWEAAKAACPAGWHLPSEAEWTELTISSGGSNAKIFPVYPGGIRHEDGSFYGLQFSGSWWSTTEGIESAWCQGVNFSEGGKYYGKDKGLSVRCVKD